MEDRYIFKAIISNGEEKGQWIQGDLSTGDSLGPTIRTHDRSLYYGAKFVDPGTICQCTGLKDKNGKLIFEGDIIKLSTSLKREIVYKDGGFCMKQDLSDNDGKWFDYLPFNGHNNFELVMEKIEVLGNIHEPSE